jgi:hypothetical protein
MNFSKRPFLFVPTVTESFTQKEEGVSRMER